MTPGRERYFWVSRLLLTCIFAATGFTEGGAQTLMFSLTLNETLKALDIGGLLCLCRSARKPKGLMHVACWKEEGEP